MNAIATKFQVGAAALAVGASAAFVPVAANAAPAMPAPAAPVHQVVGDLAAAPGDFIWFFQVTSVQLAATFTRSATFWTDTTIAIYEAAGAHGATVVVPPTKTAAVSRRRPRASACDHTILRVKEVESPRSGEEKADRSLSSTHLALHFVNSQNARIL